MYSNVVGPDPVYYEEIACTSEVVDPEGKEFPGKFKFPGGSYLADVYYASDAPGAVNVAGGGSGNCMTQYVEVVDLKLHVSCVPDQVFVKPHFSCRAQLFTGIPGPLLLPCRAHADGVLPGPFRSSVAPQRNIHAVQLQQSEHCIWMQQRLLQMQCHSFCCE